MTDDLNAEELELLAAEQAFYKKHGKHASVSEMAKELGWSKGRVKVVRENLEAKKYGKKSKSGNKHIMILLPAALGAITAGVGAIAVTSRMAPKQATTSDVVIQPSPVGEKYQPKSTDVVVVPERHIRESIIREGGDTRYEYREGGMYPYFTGGGDEGRDSQQDQSGDMLNMGWCQEQLRLVHQGDQNALAIQNQIYQICGDFYETNYIDSFFKYNCQIQNCFFTSDKVCDCTKDKFGNIKGAGDRGATEEGSPAETMEDILTGDYDYDQDQDEAPSTGLEDQYPSGATGCSGKSRSDCNTAPDCIWNVILGYCQQGYGGGTTSDEDEDESPDYYSTLFGW